MTVLVSGSTGFIGGTITRHLLTGGHSVRAMARSESRARRMYEATPAGREALAKGRLTFVEADVTALATLIPAVADVDAVVQAVQFTGAPVEDPARGLTYMQVDYGGTLNLLGAISEVYSASTAGQGMARFTDKAPRFLYMSGITAGADSPYMWDHAKWLAEEAIRASGLDWTIVRGSWAFGPGDRALNRILHYSDYLPVVPIFGDGEELLTPVFVEDIGRLWRLVIENPDPAKDMTFGLGGSETVTLNEFLRLALNTMRRRRPILHIPEPIGKVQGAIMQHMPGRPLSPDAVDFVAQEGVATEADRALLAERFPEFEGTLLREGLGYLKTRE
ncbi:MAG: NAD-dependent epimerase/dehydratase family protein [Actinobacteria bacterium]|nr:NAD-dependent epimerase/dehydratase family protein [Actinomycetota bacterium]